ncbi:transient receptor potential cation channel protein painless [Lepeophtheirus salmonis]|uniref:transient receptor potential cation channel protein painless n=1 Tax=Lepeophtheirus salmonis TaxID=72036 RepID=UPI001AE89D45|nr:transient receptor potential cation channel protein painless-like [Lepeophtheirus salmonis]XP_040583943.1 transient receptor potential cation channel protein painless-like [Lepeophtheirus salmonis]
MELLLNGEHIEPNAEDLRGNLTPLHYAANIGLQQPIRLLLDRGADPNLEFESGVTISDVIKRKIPEFDLADYVYKIKSRPLKSRLFEYVENGDIRGLESVKDEACELWNSDNGSLTLLQMACVKGYDGVVRWLLTVGGADPNARSGGEPRTPILIAAHHGYYRILRIFRDEEPRSDFTIIEPVSGKTVLHEVFRQDSAKFIKSNVKSVRGSNYRKCFDILLSDTSSKGFKDQIDSIINYREALDGDTPLHYATMQTDQDLIRAFLRRGANMGIKNKKDRTSVQCILPQTLQTFFDEDCVSWDGIITDEKFKLTFLYDFLAPPKLNNLSLEYFEDQEKNSDPSQMDRRPLPETEPLWYMSMASKEHRMLLKHPVIASFLWLKWQRIRSYFYINLFLYFTFVVLLTAFIFLKYGGGIVPKNEDGTPVQVVDTVNIILQIFLSGLLLVLFCRELFQMGVSFKRYFFNVENLLELTVIALSITIIFGSNSTPEEILMNRHLAALCVLFTWTELLVLIGRHPKLSTNIVMFRTVIGTFLTFLLWYSLIIVAFGIAFYLMMHSNGGENKFFESVSLSLLKTSTMFVGELEFSDIPFSNNALSYLIFVSFIFLIVVVLMNLLNGLAVSDTGLIREEAEVLGWLSRVELITYTESMLLGDPFYFLSNWPAIKLLKKLPHCGVCRILYKFPFMRDLLQKVTGGTKILLFYSCLPSKRATFFPNKRGKSLFGYKRSLRIDDESRKAPNLYVSTDVLESAKSLILEKLRRREEEEIAKNQFQKLEMKIDRIESILIKCISSNQAFAS